MCMVVENSMYKNQRGITLITLIISIVVIMILATVTINIAFGENGFIQRSKEANDISTNFVTSEAEDLNRVMSDYENVAVEDEKLTAATYVDSVLPTEPVLSDGMTPVKWDNIQSKWVKTNTRDSKWYNYANKEWANVVLVGEDGLDADGDEQVFNDDGTLNEDSNYSMLVWIPRYAYKITSQYHQSGSTAGNIDIVFVDTSNKSKEGAQYSPTYPMYNEGSGMVDYVVHPAFEYGGVQLPGFWVGKFETSSTNCTTDSSTGKYNGADRTLQIKAGVTSWRNITVSNIYTVCTEMNRSGNPYGLSADDNEVDPHMMKNSEWGAVAYLSQNATYGKGSEVWINNNSNYITGRAGNSTSQSYSEAGAGEYAYNTQNGQQASTTGNITGVYDMSGGAYECVAAYANNGNSNSSTYGSNLINATDRYKDVYKVTSDSQLDNYNNAAPTAGQGVPSVNTGRFGDAVWETSSTYNSGSGSWYGDYSIIPYSNSLFFLRGGGYNDGSVTGVFFFDSYNGDGNSDYGFRVVVPVL